MGTNSSELTRSTQARVMLYPSDRDATKRFYGELLGYPVVEEWDRGPDDWGVMYDAGAVTIELLSGAVEQSNTQPTLSLQVPDVIALWQALSPQIAVAFPLRHNTWGDRSIGIQDPDGTQIVFFTPDNTNT